ncbi:PREDICTED: monocarboxylate transporter 12-B-like isoform X2 [Rhagoletis zephyria]|uniref:monocarboxylate transporter 12-B-like isoform X1 n=1 Tax=Rhagoletis zephyria TaxID=28612 RepID=UPI0008114472|nr:PREDICTED: monocarboxylate transporter 12-B-like isoform X1 [Rhagoletis zephyria]XP_017473737.1 PREDICTED: monocarboxylate transporter 12-B-like isoform X2 [Rhagoletis zephyria]
MVHAPARKNKTTNGNCDLVEDVLTPVPPDGGWGWMVVFGSFMIHIITDGMTYSFGLFYNEFLSYFNEGKGYTAWIVSIMVGVTYASGPISSSFVNRYGCRAVTIAGSIFAAACIVASIFAQNVLTLIFTIGIGTGFGLGLIYLPAIVSVTTWFEAKRSLATGIAVCGSGFGTFVFAPLTEHLIGSFGWRGAMLIIGGIVLNCIIFGALFRPLEPPKPEKVKKSSLIDNHTTSAELKPLKSAADGGDQYLQLPVAQALCRSNSVGHGFNSNNLRQLRPSLAHCRMLSLDLTMLLAQVKCSSFPTPSDDSHINQTDHTFLLYANNNQTVSNGANGKTPDPTSVQSTSSTDMVRHRSQPHLDRLEPPHENWGSGTMYRPDILYQGSLLNIPEYTASRTDISGTGITKRYGSVRHAARGSQSQEVMRCCGCMTCSKETHDTFVEMMNFSLLKDVVFIVFALSNFFTSIGFNVPYIYIVSQAETLQLGSEQSSYLIAIIGGANTIGRIVLGYLADKPWVNRLWVYNVCLTLCGVSTAMAPLCTGFYSLAGYCAAFGFTIGAYVGLTSVILVDLLGLEKLTNAFGLLLLFQGVASFIGPPIGGWLYDVTDSYGPAFLMAGITIAISGIMLFGIPPLQRHIEAKTKKQQQATAQTLSLS